MGEYRHHPTGCTCDVCFSGTQWVGEDNRLLVRDRLATRRQDRTDSRPEAHDGQGRCATVAFIYGIMEL